MINMNDGIRRYNSKKFAVAVLLILVTMFLAYVEKLTPTVGSIFTGIGVMFPAAQAYADSRNRE